MIQTGSLYHPQKYLQKCFTAWTLCTVLVVHGLFTLIGRNFKDLLIIGFLTHRKMVCESMLSTIKSSIEPTHGSVRSDVKNLQPMDVLKLQSTEADWNTKCPFHILAYIYRNLFDISISIVRSRGFGRVLFQ